MLDAGEVPNFGVVPEMKVVPKMEVVPEEGKFFRIQTSPETQESNLTHQLTMPQAAGNNI